MHRPILAALAEGPLTIPEIAIRIGAPSQETVYWVMGMLRYGHLEELEACDEGYYADAIAGQEVGPSARSSTRRCSAT